MPHDNSSLTHHVTVRAKSVVESVSVTPEDAFILRRKYVNGLSATEIAVLADMTPGAVRVRLHRLKKRLPNLADL